jgi:hypothetical protein
MTTIDAKREAKRISQLWPQSTTPAQIVQLAAEFESDDYTHANVHKLVSEMYSSKAFFSLPELRDRLRIRREYRNDDFEKTRLSCLKREDDDVRALREIGALDSHHIEGLKSRAIERLCEGIASKVSTPVSDDQRDVATKLREKWVQADWRENRALLRTMHELLESEPLLALPAPAIEGEIVEDRHDDEIRR